MRIAVIGAGPTGLLLGAALARRGHRVVAVDRDPGPDGDGRWERRGVMQFEHAHAFRPQVPEALLAELPEAYDAWVDAGAEPVQLDLGAGTVLAGMRSRRQTFETALRATAVGRPGFTLRVGHVDGVVVEDGRAGGIAVDGEVLPADLVIDASGRSGRASRTLPPRRGVGGPCGIVYVDRQYQLHAGAEPGPMLNAIAWQGDFDGYLVLVFLHERGIFSVLLIRSAADEELVDLRHAPAFEAACRAIPALAAWTDPERSRPITRVLPGGNLKNHYLAQTGDGARLVLPGLVFAGDAVCTTTPNFGRGITTSLLQARELLRLVDAHRSDVVTVGEAFEAWCEQHMRPWAEDHIRMDESLRRRWSGEDVDLTQRLPSDLILAAGAVEPEIQSSIGPYLAMTAGPSCLDPVEPLAREVYARGWRPQPTPGPTVGELRAVVRAALAGRV